jgi:hypothetical protein
MSAYHQASFSKYDRKDGRICPIAETQYDVVQVRVEMQDEA